MYFSTFDLEPIELTPDSIMLQTGDRPLSVVGLRRKRCPVTLDCDGMVSIPASPDARNVPLLICRERFYEASLPAASWCTHAL